MIINTGQRTDIPAFYSKWFMNRIREGYVLVRNPYYPSQVTKFTLDPRVVDCLGFCTKNPKPMLPYLDELKDYGMFWYVTITGFVNDIEPHVPPIDSVIESVKALSLKLGKDSIGWRYTPIIINDKYTIDYHIATFEHIASSLEGYVRLAVFGFLDLYDKLKRNHPELKDSSDSDKIKIALEFKEIAERHHLELRLCSKEKWLKDYGIDIDGCMRLEDYSIAIHKELKPKTKMQARKGYCGCMLSNDIGSYNSCLHLCQYCYANGNPNLIINNYKHHSDRSPFLIGYNEPGDSIKEAYQESWIKEEKENNKSLF